MKRTANQRKWMIAGTILILVAVVLLARRGREATVDAEPVQTVAVTRGSVKATVVATGAVQPETSVDVKANAGGEVTSLLVDVGDVVKAGDLIATIDPTDSQTTVRTARADMTSSQASVTQARATDTLERTTLPSKITDAVEAIKAARASVRAAEENLRMAQSTASTNVDSAEQDRLIAGERATRADTSRTMGESAVANALKQAIQSRDEAAAKLAQAEANLSLAGDTVSVDLERAKQSRAAAAARLQRAKLAADTTPSSATAAVREAEASLAGARQRLAKLTGATQPGAAANAEGDYEAAKVSLSASEAELKRQRELYGKGYVPYTGVETAETALAAARAKFQAASQAWKDLKGGQSADRAEAESSVAQAEASLTRAKENLRASGTTGFDVADAEASLRSAEQDLKLAEQGEKTLQLRREDVRVAKAALARSDAAVAEAQSQLMDVNRLGNDVTEAQISARRSEIAKAQAEANRRLVQVRSADLDAARAQLKRSEAQLQQVYAQRYKLVQNAAAVTQAAAGVVRNAAQVENAEKQMRDTIIRAPRNGVVIEKFVEEGTIITSGRSSVAEGTKIVNIADVTSLYCLAAVDESDVGKVAAGQKASFKVEAFGDREFAATVRKVYPKGVVTANITQFTVELGVERTDVTLRPGMSADIEILTEEKAGVLTLPAEAVREGSAGFYVLVPADSKAGAKAAEAKGDAKDGGKAGAEKSDAKGGAAKSGAKTDSKGGAKADEEGTRVLIKVGITTSDTIEILDGLAEGDQVIVPGSKGRGGGSGKQADAKGGGNQEQMQRAVRQGMRSMGVGGPR